MWYYIFHFPFHFFFINCLILVELNVKEGSVFFAVIIGIMIFFGDSCLWSVELFSYSKPSYKEMWCTVPTLTSRNAQAHSKLLGSITFMQVSNIFQINMAN